MDAQVLLSSIFDGHGDGFINWKKFKKWATGSKRPPQFVGLLNWFPLLYERAILYSSAPPLLTPVGANTNLIDFSFDDLKSNNVPQSSQTLYAPPPSPVFFLSIFFFLLSFASLTSMYRKPEKTSKTQRLSQIMHRRSMDHAQAHSQQPVGNDNFLSDLTLTPITPTLVPIVAGEPAPGTPTAMPRLPSNPSTPSTPTTRNNMFAPPPIHEESPVRSATPPPSLSTPPLHTPPPPSTAAPSLTPPTVAPGSPNRSRANTSLGNTTLPKKSTSTSTANSSDGI